MCWREGYEAATANHAAEIERLRAAATAVVVYHERDLFLSRAYEKLIVDLKAALAGTPEGEDE